MCDLKDTSVVCDLLATLSFGNKRHKELELGNVETRKQQGLFNVISC